MTSVVLFCLRASKNRAHDNTGSNFDWQCSRYLVLGACYPESQRTCEITIRISYTFPSVKRILPRHFLLALSAKKHPRRRADDWIYRVDVVRENPVTRVSQDADAWAPMQAPVALSDRAKPSPVMELAFHSRRHRYCPARPSPYWSCFRWLLCQCAGAKRCS